MSDDGGTVTVDHETQAEALEEALEKIQQQERELMQAADRERQWREQVQRLTGEAENDKLRAEVELLRAVERARQEEQERLQQWMDDVRERFQAEKKALEDKVADLEEGRCRRIW